MQQADLTRNSALVSQLTHDAIVLSSETPHEAQNCMLKIAQCIAKGTKLYAENSTVHCKSAEIWGAGLRGGLRASIANLPHRRNKQASGFQASANSTYY